MRPYPPKTYDDLIYGIHPVLEAIEAGRELDKIFLRKGISAEIRNTLTTKAREKEIVIQTVPIEKLDRLCRRGNHQGVAALAALISYTPVEELVTSAFEKGDEPRLIMLDSLTDVRNFGAIARTAEALGFAGIIIPAQGSVRVNAEAVRISAGALNHLKIAKERFLPDTGLMLQAHGLKLIACTEKAEKTVQNGNFDGPICLIMGSEEKGIGPKLLKLADDQVRIPMKGRIASLNVSVAAGIVMMEAMRGRN